MTNWLTPDEWSGLREDVGYIKANIENHNDRLAVIEDKVHDVERVTWGLGGLSALAAALAGVFVR